MAMYGKFCFVGYRNGILGVIDNFSGLSNCPDIWQPAADLIEVDGGFLVQMDLPGVDPGSVEAVIDGQRLAVHGVRRAHCPTQGRRYIHMEICRGEFGKIIHLPEPVAENNADGSLRDGVLEIFLPFGRQPLYSATTICIKRIT